MYKDANVFSDAVNDWLCYMISTNGGQEHVEQVGYFKLSDSQRVAEGMRLGCPDVNNTLTHDVALSRGRF